MPSNTPDDSQSPVTRAEFQRYQRLISNLSVVLVLAVGLLCVLTVILCTT
ncbi:hypothetical protein [Streptomyces microflavus]